MVKVLSGCSLILQVQLAVSPKAELILNIFVPTNAVQAEGTWEGSTQECAFVLMPLCCRAVEGAGENKKTLQATLTGTGEPDFMQIKDGGRMSY